MLWTRPRLGADGAIEETVIAQNGWTAKSLNSSSLCQLASFSPDTIHKQHQLFQEEIKLKSFSLSPRYFVSPLHNKNR